jgi:hypothetical protein
MDRWLLRRHPAARCVATIIMTVLMSIGPAFAWNNEGHMAVAYLAYRRLTPAARTRVNELLKRNPNYSKWLATMPKDAPQGDINSMVFMIAATWPDQIRGDPTYLDDGPNDGNSPPEGPEATRNIGYSDHLRHKYWHFINIPYSEDGTALPPVPSPNAETQIAAFRTALDSSKSDDIKAYDLAWLEHLVGDIHQPLHAATGVSRSMPRGDAGGGLSLLCNAPCSDSLHLFWDRLVGSQSSITRPPPTPPGNYPGVPGDLMAEVQSAKSAAILLPKADANLAAKMKETDWVQESFDLAKQYVYVPPIGMGAGPFTMTTAYFEMARRVARDRVALAGVRLSNLLNQELK